MVVERGLARCPRCVAVADYVFIEPAEPGPRGLRYEVRCRKCGEFYSEDSRTVANLPAVVEESLHWPPDLEPVPPRDWRNEVREKWAVTAERGKTELEALGQQVHTVFDLTRTWVEERRAARALNQTGGYAGGG